ncbi:MAG: helix-turn-helix domain-containing protein [Candidatus Binatia bacterium]
MKNKRRTKERVEVGSGNVFADLGFEDPEDEAFRAALVYWLAEEIKARGLTQAEAAKMLGVDQPSVSRLMRGQFERFSVERIIRFLMNAGRDVRIVLPSPTTSRKRRPGRLFIEAA